MERRELIINNGQASADKSALQYEQQFMMVVVTYI
jgi:hypothetical protein